MPIRANEWKGDKENENTAKEGSTVENVKLHLTKIMEAANANKPASCPDKVHLVEEVIIDAEADDMIGLAYILYVKEHCKSDNPRKLTLLLNTREAKLDPKRGFVARQVQKDSPSDDKYEKV